MKVKVHSSAEEDLNDGCRFYEAQSPGLGSYFRDSLYSDIDSLAYYAGVHPRIRGFYRLMSKRFPFAIYYDVVGDTATVFAVLDCRRDPEWIRRRLMRG